MEETSKAFLRWRMRKMYAAIMDNSKVKKEYNKQIIKKSIRMTLIWLFIAYFPCAFIGGTFNPAEWLMFTETFGRILFIVAVFSVFIGQWVWCKEYQEDWYKVKEIFRI